MEENEDLAYDPNIFFTQFLVSFHIIRVFTVSAFLSGAQGWLRQVKPGTGKEMQHFDSGCQATYHSTCPQGDV